MRAIIILAVLIASTLSASAYTSRNRIGTQFESDIRANNESMRSRFSDRTNRIETHNERMRERLNSTRGGVAPLRR